jgi:hypothetical protein
MIQTGKTKYREEKIMSQYHMASNTLLTSNRNTKTIVLMSVKDLN